VVAVARKDGEIVGVGTVKPVREDYNAGVARKSGVSFDPATPEFGYVVVHPDHRDRHLSSKLTTALLSRSGKSLFATTSDDKIKTNLKKAGFAERGRKWKGRRGDQISFWIKE
jgi:predicted GNAT family N-acyltransferase